MDEYRIEVSVCMSEREKERERERVRHMKKLTVVKMPKGDAEHEAGAWHQCTLVHRRAEPERRERTTRSICWYAGQLRLIQRLFRFLVFQSIEE